MKTDPFAEGAEWAARLSPLHMACENEDIERMEDLIRGGADPDFVPPCGYPAIFQALDVDLDGASQEGKEPDFRITKHLLTLGANPALRDNEGKSLREFTARYGAEVLSRFDELLGELIESGIRDHRTD